jgi:hypothetical protein
MPVAAAQVPRLVKFSGAVKDASGKPVSNVAGIAFALYQDQQGGTPLWIENQNVQPDAAGRYTVWLGATQNDGVPVELFASGQARWMGVQVEGQPEQARVLLAAVPYALKAADAETVGGLPPSAFLLAGTAIAAGGHAGESNARSDWAAAGQPAVAGTGTQNYIPIWTDSVGDLGNSVLFQSGTGSTAKIGVNITKPAATLDVKGTGIIRGTLSLPTTGTATATAGNASEPLNLAASVFNSGTSAAVGQTFQLKAEPVGNDTPTASGALSVLYGSGTSAPVETGLRIGSNGQITFATGQTFPGTGVGTVTSVGSGSGLTGGPITTSGTLSIAAGGVTNTMLANPSLTVVAGTDLTGGGTAALGGTTTLNLDTTKVPQLNGANIFTGNQSVTGNVTANGTVQGGVVNALNGFEIGGYPAINATGSGSGNFSAGLGALPPSTTGTYDTAVGDYALNANTTGFYNTASGALALYSNTTGNNNTASGQDALYWNTTGSSNTAAGSNALGFNTTGTQNTASGALALSSNTTGWDNTANGGSALQSNSTGNYNTASGYRALAENTTGSNNTASGYSALVSNTTGNYNTATGSEALWANTTGYNDTASGNAALAVNTTGNYNTASGNSALGYNTTGNYNTAMGSEALAANTSGSDNIAIGYLAGFKVIGNSNNIHIANQGTASDSGVIRIGDAQTSAYIAGIYGVTTSASNAVQVLIDSNGNLGTISSSRRYKEDIRDMGDASSGLMRLRPVSFRYKKAFDDGAKPIQYGLIAEEVAEVYPDLVAGSADGRIETVRYQVLDSMLLNEMQKQNATIAAQKEQIRAQEQVVRDQGQQIRSLEERLARVEAGLAATAAITASR